MDRPEEGEDAAAEDGADLPVDGAGEDAAVDGAGEDPAGDGAGEDAAGDGDDDAADVDGDDGDAADVDGRSAGAGVLAAPGDGPLGGAPISPPDGSSCPGPG